ncbi:tRNA (adenosine(37)-N6)-threonylcarbamoyltransferase complex dimerization subunit type 1 TsaB [Candidatus Pseudomonas adelgestsugas]|uniref:tRNA threonylcarbamoyladenosine biosynthesis protein TsaB n=1 Tax=Candidatus Pseudomonas adelgestsugas TaxID=1302376 RepID=A0ABX5R8F0_9PSED|nr:tRNA (adenosine(37)-N6)-threonylcarbamoyltransferase complex dimerization subunit type 1 TsaB [Candidatus Pseudomonas adelgestsugas]QAX81833.1 tRNA threonylcarbamoyladenosine biosynthesis protein TsaB [Candidatus Pseudomonas adelgestsugas]
MSTLLAIDTATEACSVALLQNGKVTSHYEVVPRLHSQKLLPMIKKLLEETGTKLSTVDAIAFGRGPGAFTGVRLTIGVVQGLAFALKCPVLPVSNLAVLAQRALREYGATQVAAAIDARMDEVYWGCYREMAGEMCLVGAEVVQSPEFLVLSDNTTSDWFGAGTGWSYSKRILVKICGHDDAMLPHAIDLLTLARFAFKRGEEIPADQAAPTYLRNKVTQAKPSYEIL